MSWFHSFAQLAESAHRKGSPGCQRRSLPKNTRESGVQAKGNWDRMMLEVPNPNIKSQAKVKMRANMILNSVAQYRETPTAPA